MDKELYIKGNEELVSKVVEFVRPMIGKNKVWIVDVSPNYIPQEQCDCGGDILATCQDCGETEQFSKEE